MSEKALLPPGRFYPAGYVLLLKLLTERARDHGYAIGVHGSLSRDLDLIAVPWTEEAADGEALVKALAASIAVDEARITPPPEQKPHGRVAWTILLGGGAFIDVSVMPRRLEARDGVRAWIQARIEECRRDEVKFAAPLRGPKDPPPQALVEAWTERRALQTVLRILDGAAPPREGES